MNRITGYGSPNGGRGMTRTAQPTRVGTELAVRGSKGCELAGAERLHRQRRQRREDVLPVRGATRNRLLITA